MIYFYQLSLIFSSNPILFLFFLGYAFFFFASLVLLLLLFLWSFFLARKDKS